MPSGSETDSRLPLGQCVTLACLLEATAAKPGNVWRGADFDDLSYVDFLVSATTIGPIFQRAVDRRQRLGPLVLDAVGATRQAVGTNTNLGTILLLAPLALVERDESLATGVADVLADLDADDARLVYQAIAHAQPGGMGRVDEADLAGPPPEDLIGAMRLAAGRDQVARQYAENFSPLLQTIVPWFLRGLQAGWSLEATIVRVHLMTMSEFPDSLIGRKRGPEVAREAADRAAATLAAGEPGEENYERALAALDFWLRSDGHRRNPGTTADLIAAGLFVLLRDGLVTLPLCWRA